MKKTLSLLLALVFLFSLTACGGSKPTVTPSQLKPQTTSAPNATPSVDPTEKPEKTEAPTKTSKPAPSGDVYIEEQVIIDQDDIVVTVKSLNLDASYYAAELKVLIENNTDTDVNISLDHCAVNGIMIGGYLYATIAAGKKSNETISFYEDDFEEVGISTIKSIDLVVNVYETESYDDIIVSDLIMLETIGNEDYVQEYYTAGDLVFEQDGIKLVVQGVTVYGDDDYYGAEIFFYAENNSENTVTINARNVAINGFMIDGYLYATILPGYKSYDSMTLYDDDLEENDITEIEEFEGSFRVYDANTWKDYFSTDTITLTF